MILINLLPREYRQKSRAPAKFLAVIAASVAINTSLVAYWAWTAFGLATEVRAELALLEDTKEGLEPQVAYHRDLEAESQVFASREKTLGDVTANRVSWTQQVDSLIQLINVGGDGEKYLIWLDDLNAEMRENTRSGTYGKLKANGHSGDTSFAHVANFLEDIEDSPLVVDFYPPAPPEGSQSIVEEDLIPAEVWSFPLELTLRSPEERRELKERKQ